VTGIQAFVLPAQTRKVHFAFLLGPELCIVWRAPVLVFVVVLAVARGRACLLLVFLKGNLLLALLGVQCREL